MRLAWNKGQGKAHADYAGRRFGSLTALRKGDVGSHVNWWCRCNCGTEKQVSIYSLLRGATVSCGCENGARKRTHGLSRTREWRIWYFLIRRCHDPMDKAYYLYGARGIAVCDRWRKSFEHFTEDIGKRPSLSHSVDRIDNDGPYSPENCRWATRKEQSRNTRATKYWVLDGIPYPGMGAVHEATGIHRATLQYRFKSKWFLNYRMVTKEEAKLMFPGTPFEQEKGTP